MSGTLGVPLADKVSRLYCPSEARAGESKVRRLVTFMIVLFLAFVGEITAAKSVEAKKLHGQLLGCWENKRFGNGLDNQRTEERLIGSYLVCFRKDGRVTGLTYDAGDAWEWSYDYRLTDSWVFVAGRTWGQVEKIASKTMTVEMNGKPIDFEFLCRSKKENTQCERLEYGLAP
jgi:hypothetical protein